VPPEDVELVKSAFETWNRGDIDAFVDYTSEDVAWLEVSGRPEGGATERVGRERLRQGLKSLFDAWRATTSTRNGSRRPATVSSP
jgi:ketosteroid isomerase-like protein